MWLLLRKIGLSSISEDEIQTVLWSLPEDKAPDPDGFSPCFFRWFWFVIHDDVAAVREFFVSAQMPNSLNNTFITLILK